MVSNIIYGYFVLTVFDSLSLNPKILSSVKHDLKPSLKTMEEPHLRALIKEDLKLHPNSKISEIHKRMEDFDLKYLRRIVYKMYEENEINRDGEKKSMIYFLGK